MTSIQQATCDYFGICLDGLVGSSRALEIIIAKHVARYLEREAGRSLHQIARLYGLSDHTAVLASARHVAARLEADDEVYTAPVSAITGLVKARQEQSAATTSISQIRCPTCGGEIVRELQRQVAELHARLNEIARPALAGVKSETERLRL